MAADDTPKVPDPATLKDDPTVLTRTGEFLQAAGLPFEENEFDATSARELEAQGLDPETGQPRAEPVAGD